MFNQELAKILYEIGYFLEMEEIPFKPYAYQKVAVLLDTFEQDVRDIYKKQGIKGLEKISGIGKNIAEKIQQEFSPNKITEIGSNDGVFIKHFNKEKVTAIEPCNNFAKLTNEQGYKTFPIFWN